MGAERAAPAVVVVVVASDPGDWFEESLISLAAQDYDNYSVVVVDASATEGVPDRVRKVLPAAQVWRVLAATSFAESVNHAVSKVEGVAHVLVCHDDVALAPDVLRLLVEEAYRRNGGLTCPKLVRWDAPEKLLSVGLGADRLGVAHPLVETGELDQGQHDAAREVFLAPSAALLVRTDLWQALGGFDPALGSPGEDLDLCWRAQLAGARVVVAPHAHVRHLEARASGLRSGSTGAAPELDAQREANRLRTLWTCYSVWALLAVVPVSVLFALAEALWGLSHHKKSQDVALPLVALGSSLRQPRQLWRSRRQAQHLRRARDISIWKAQSKGSARVRSLVRQRLERGHQLAWAASRAPSAHDAGGPQENGSSHRSAPRFSTPNWQVTASVAAVVVAILLVGSRSALGQHLPLVGQLPSTVGGVGGWWRSWWSGGGVAGLGSRALGLPGSFLLGLVGLLGGGSANVAVHYLVFGPLLVGPLGIYMEAKPFGSYRGRLAASVLYAAMPLPYNAVAQGHFGGLIAYAVAPWVIGQVGRLSGAAPYGDGGSGAGGRSWGRFVALGLFVAAAASLAPALLPLVLVVGVALGAGSVLLGCRDGSWRLVSSAVATALVAFVALLPWSWGLLRSWSALVGPAGPDHGVSVAGLLRFHTGPFGGSPLDWAIVVAAAVSLFIGRSWRLAWAGRLWVVALVCFALAWAGGQGWFAVPETEVLLAPAAAALALAAALGGAAVEADLSGYRFGWHQFVPAFGALAVLGASLPLLGWAANGQWDLPDAGAEAAFSFPGPAGGDYRVLWVGPAAVLPLAAQGRTGALSFATSEDGLPTMAQAWPPPGPGEAPLVARYLGWALDGQTTGLPQLLSSFAVRFVVVPVVPATAGLVAGLERQVNLVAAASTSAYQVFACTDWTPVSAVLAAPPPPRATPQALLSGPPGALVPVLTNSVGAGVTTLAANPVGPAGAGRVLYGAVPPGTWDVDVNGHGLGAHPALGWASSWALPSGRAGERAVITPTGETGRHAMDFIMLLLWTAAASLAVGGLRSRWRAQLALARLESGSAAAEVSEIDWSDSMEGETVG